MTVLPSRLSGALLTLAAGAALAFGCSSSNNDSSDYCAQVAAAAKACPNLTPCDQAFAADCTTYTAQYSSSYLSAISACTGAITCPGADGGVDKNGCILTKEAQLTPSATQTKFGQDYCAVCGGGLSVSACTAQFFGADEDAGVGFSVGGNILPYSDTFVSNLDAKCVQTLGADAGVTGCEAVFTCVYEQVQAMTPAVCFADGGT